MYIHDCGKTKRHRSSDLVTLALHAIELNAGNLTFDCSGCG